LTIANILLTTTTSALVPRVGNR